MSNTFGTRLRVTIFGQSHAPAIGALIEGLPAGIALDMAKILSFMARRAPGRADTGTSRKESDIPRIVSGLNEHGETCGAPLCALIENSDTRSADYAQLRDIPRPGHADFTAHLQSGLAHDIRGGGQFSGRLTAPLCFAGAVCAQLPQLRGVSVGAHIASLNTLCDAPFDPMGMDAHVLDALAQKPFPTLCDDAGEAMRAAILSAKQDGDSLGGMIEAIAQGVPEGLGGPMFDGVENKLAQALFAIPAIRGVEFGRGFAAAQMRGSEHNDAFVISANGTVRTATNHHGGALGGITSGMPILLRAAIKPTPSISITQQSVSLSKNEAEMLRIVGRHDPCIAPRAVPCVEAAIWITLADMVL